MKLSVRALSSLVCLLLAFHAKAQTSPNQAVDVAAKVIRPEQIRAHMRFLSDSLLQGRAPGTPGYDIAARYVATELEGMGLRPAVSGSWYQPVAFKKRSRRPRRVPSCSPATAKTRS
jgi:hypothetical protein